MLKNNISIQERLNTKDYISLNKVTLLSESSPDFPYHNNKLLSFKLEGDFRFKEFRDGYYLIAFYKFLYASNPTGWYSVRKLDKNNYSMPHLIPLNEMEEKAWKYNTTRLYVDKETPPRIEFIVFIITKEVAEKYKLEDDRSGWGLENLEELKKLSTSHFSNTLSWPN